MGKNKLNKSIENNHNSIEHKIKCGATLPRRDCVRVCSLLPTTYSSPPLKHSLTPATPPNVLMYTPSRIRTAAHTHCVLYWINQQFEPKRKKYYYDIYYIPTYKQLYWLRYTNILLNWKLYGSIEYNEKSVRSCFFQFSYMSDQKSVCVKIIILSVSIFIVI